MMATKPKSGHAWVVAGVKTFCRQYGLTISPKPGDSPLIGRGEWFQLFDTWEDAQKFFIAARNDHIDLSKPYPWAESRYPGPVDGEPFGPRKRNPIMATQPSAAQMAARKTFAEMAKAGAFKKRAAPARKNPAAKRRKKNPFDDMTQPPAPKGPKNAFKRNPSAASAIKRLGHGICSWVQDGYPFKQALAIALKSAGEKFTPAQVKSAEKLARESLNYPDPIRVTRNGVVRRNPVKRKNPSMPAHRNPSAYCVHRVKTDGEPGALLATFASLPLAKEYAKAYAQAHGAQVGIVGKR